MRAGGVLGRLARFLAQWLRGLAWRLDHAAGSTTVPQPALAALAERFPGAPAHWLADIARQMIEAGEPLPGVDYSPPPIEAPPAQEPRSRASASALPPPPVRRTRPSLRLIGSAPPRMATPEMAKANLHRRRSETGKPDSAAQRRPARLRWLGVSPKASAEIIYPEHPASSRGQAEFAIDASKPEQITPDSPSAFRDADRLTNLSSAPDRAPSAAAQFAAPGRLARRTFIEPNEPSLRLQETAFATPIRPSVADISASPDFSVPTRIPVEFAQLHPAQRVSLSFPRGRPQRGNPEWTTTPGTRWPALPPHEQTIADAPTHASPLTDLTREQMAGQWNA